jgi:hypothetical protein
MHCFGEISYSHDNVATTVDMHFTPAMKDGWGSKVGTFHMNNILH